jgi:hypothetical protein
VALKVTDEAVQMFGRRAFRRTRRSPGNGRICAHCVLLTGRTPCTAGRWQGMSRKYTQERV